MSTKKKQPNLNLSGFSPIQLNINSPSAIKSPGKDYGINERVELGKEKIISGVDRWKLAEANGSQCLNIIHNLKDKARRSGDSVYPVELETYCKKLEAVKTVLNDVIKGSAEFRREIVSSISILDSMKENEELKSRLVTVKTFLDALMQLYDLNFKQKELIIENIAHSASDQDSQLLIAAWTCDATENEIFRLVTQLKVSPVDYQWIIA